LLASELLEVAAMNVKLDSRCKQAHQEGVGKLAKSTGLYSVSAHGWYPMDFHRGRTLWQRSDLPRTQVQPSACPLSLSLHWDRKKPKRWSLGG
jgi:hypothetical protein